MSDAYEVETVGQVTVLRLRDLGMFEFESIPSTGKIVEDFLRDSPTETTLLDLGQIPFTSSLALGLIASLRQKAERHGRTLALCNLHPQSRWAIQTTRLQSLLPQYFDEEQALAKLSSQRE